MGKRDFAPIHPGEVLLHDFMEPMGLSQYRVAVSISVPPRRINQIVHCERAITPDTALRLSRYFGLSDSYWLNLQSLYDLQMTKEQMHDTLNAIEPIAAKGSNIIKQASDHGFRRPASADFRSQLGSETVV